MYKINNMETPITAADIKTTLAASPEKIFNFGNAREASKVNYFETTLTIARAQRNAKGETTTSISARKPYFTLGSKSDLPADWITIRSGPPQKGDKNDKRNVDIDKYNPSIGFNISSLNALDNFGDDWVTLNEYWEKSIDAAIAAGSFKKGSRSIRALYYCKNKDLEPVEHPMLTLNVNVEDKYSPKHPSSMLKGKYKTTILDARKPIKAFKDVKTKTGGTRHVEYTTGYEPYVHTNEEGEPVPVTHDNIHEVLTDGTAVKHITWVGGGLSVSAGFISCPQTVFEIVIAPVERALRVYDDMEDELISDDDEELASN